MTKKGRNILISVIVGILLLFIVPIIIFSSMKNNKVFVRTTELTKQTLTNSISIMGTVESNNYENLYSLQNFPVKKVLVELGDEVKAGDVICILDASTLEQQLALKESALNLSNSSAYYQLKTAEDNYLNLKNSIDTNQNSTLISVNSQYETAKISLDAAQKAYDDLKKDIDKQEDSQLIALNTQLEDAYDAIKAAEAAYDKAFYSLLTSDERAEINTLEKMVETTRQNMKDDPSESNKQRYDNYYKDLITSIPASLQGLRQSLETARNSYDSIEISITSREKALNSQFNSIDSQLKNAKTAYDSAVAAKEATQTQLYQQLEATEDAYNNALKNAKNEPSVLELAALKENINNCTVKATKDGIITSINVAEGGYPQGTIATVADLNDLIIKGTVKEYDIKDIKIGEKAIIKTNVTGDKEFYGTVTVVSPSSEYNNVTGKKGITVKIKVESTETGMMIGTEAKVKAIVMEVTDTYAVPYEAITKNSEEEDIIYIAEKNGKGYKAKAIKIKTGIETNMNIEVISDELTEGMTVITDAEKVTDGMLVFLNTMLPLTTTEE